jgi:very-short-patch-repair endonuclease
VRGQSVRTDKLALAKRLRREMTLAERTLWRVLRRNELGGLHFRRQQVIEGYIVDFYCDSANVAIEVDGGVHEGRGEYDELRGEAIARRGVRVIRISNEALRDIEAVIEFIKREIPGTKPLTPSPAGTGDKFKERNLTPNPFPRREGE